MEATHLAIACQLQQSVAGRMTSRRSLNCDPGSALSVERIN